MALNRIYLPKLTFPRTLRGFNSDEADVFTRNAADILAGIENRFRLFDMKARDNGLCMVSVKSRAVQGGFDHLSAKGS